MTIVVRSVRTVRRRRRCLFSPKVSHPSDGIRSRCIELVRCKPDQKFFWSREGVSAMEFRKSDCERRKKNENNDEPERREN